MTRQWIRECRLTVEGASGAIDLSTLRIRFKISHNTLQSPNAGDITITNVSKQTADMIKQEGKTVTLEAGYQGSAGVIFKGDIIQKRYGRENPTDTYLNLIAKSGDTAYNFGVANKTLAAGHTRQDQVDHVLEVLKPYGITKGHISDLGPLKFPRGRTLFGMARNILRDLCAPIGADWWVQDGKLNILKSQETLPGGAFKLSSETGLIGMPVQTLDGILARSLINPQLRPGTRIQIDQKSIQEAQFSTNYTAEKTNSLFPSIATDGFYKVIYLDRVGDTRGGPWYDEINCIRADGQGPIPLSYAPNGIVDPDTGQKYQEGTQ